MDVRIDQGGGIGADEFPLIRETLEYFDVIMDVDDFGVTYFRDHVEAGADYAVMATPEFRRLDEAARQDLRRQLQAAGLDGQQSRQDLEAFVDGLQRSRVERVVADIAALHRDGLSAADRAAVDARVQRIADDFRSGAAAELRDLLADARVARPLDAEHAFLEQPAPDAETLQQLRQVSMPACFVLDVSYSMAHAGRIEHANAFVERLAGHRDAGRVDDEVTCLIYWGETRFIDLQDRRRFHVGESTDTGGALRAVGDAICEGEADAPVFVALVTDGLPNVGGQVDGQELDPVDYAVRMAARLPANVVLCQFAFAPLDPGDPDRPESLSDFEDYLRDLKRVTDAAPRGQTCVLVPDSEPHLPWLPIAAWQQARQLVLRDRGFAVWDEL